MSKERLIAGILVSVCFVDRFLVLVLVRIGCELNGSRLLGCAVY